MSIQIYIGISLILAALDGIGLPIWQIATGDFTIGATFAISVKLAFDILFVSANWYRVRVRRFELLLMSWVLIAALIGLSKILLVGDGDFSVSRVIRDTLPPLLFFLKFAIFVGYFRRQELPYRPIIWVLLLVSCASVLVFYALGGASTAYVGLTPPINPVLAGSVAQSSVALFLLAILVIYYSGKRSFLLSAGLYLIWVMLRFKNLKHIVSASFLIRMAGVAAISVTAGALFQGAIIDKFSMTAEGLSEIATVASTGVDRNDIETALYLATAGRSVEFTTIVDKMTPVKWLLGQGAGFSYAFTLLDGNTVEGYANSHFSPLSLAYKFGAPFALLLYLWMFAEFKFSRADTREVIFWRGVVFVTVVQSMFAFNLFVEFLLPIALAAVKAGGSMREFAALREASSPAPR